MGGLSVSAPEPWTVQSFFMRYYHDLFFRIVDTSSVAFQTVEGEWGFRSHKLLHHIRTSGINYGPIKER
ncbi:hypothetical protein P171DRAFT_433401 [Karstenula rhodostoma CBS 690.94]|uniref:Uncharacterized protein n=1 Tax=Karstenula rhodostoma CBS 690.94 TaxID=1392251 RepID=A0A9P4PFP0_9PLEO|nr:hypothetical protein P171DRAFT_433401 [Karstenula rhodostoma CBS 690.94]